MTSVRLYVGSNNKTGEVEKAKLVDIVAKYVDGFTIFDAIGMWKGKQEKSAIVELSGDFSLNDLIGDIKRELQQEAVGYVITPEISFA